MPRERPLEPPGPPAGEQARIPVIWLAELFTPITIPGLLGGVRELTSKLRGRQPRNYDDSVESIISDRRRGGGGWHSLPLVRPSGSLPYGDEVDDQVPAGIEYIQLKLHSLTSTVTALTAQFGLDDVRAHGLERILNQELLPSGNRCPEVGWWHGG
jgi:hypothetical protein